jgi:uncharacterized RDD family membrane protein YckC
VPDPDPDALPEQSVLSLDNVRLDLPIAGPGTRGLAASLDYLLVTILIVLWFFALDVGLGMSGVWAVVLGLVGFFLIEYGYFAGLEAATGGRTFGKWALGLHVVTRTGGRPALASLLIRNAVRSVDLVVGVPLMAMDPLSRRLGDRLADTLVLRSPERAPRRSVGRLPRGWGGREVAIVEGLLSRAAEIEPAHVQRLAGKLLDAIDRDDPTFLEGLERGPDAVAVLRRAVDFVER